MSARKMVVFTTSSKLAPAVCEHGGQVVHRLLGLRVDALQQLSGCGVQPELPRSEHEVAGADALAVRAQMAGGCRGGVNCLAC